MSILHCVCRYRRPFRPLDLEEHADGNVWNYDADTRDVLVSARLNRESPLVITAIPVCGTTTPGRRIVSPIGAGETSFSIEPHEADGLCRARVILLDAPADVAARLRSLESL